MGSGSGETRGFIRRSSFVKPVSAPISNGSDVSWFPPRYSAFKPVNDPISAELYIRRVVERHPETVAALDALRLAPRILSRMPAAIAAEAPDYQLLAEAMLGASAPLETGVEATSKPLLPRERTLETERSVEADPTPETGR